MMLQVSRKQSLEEVNRPGCNSSGVTSRSPSASLWFLLYHFLHFLVLLTQGWNPPREIVPCIVTVASLGSVDVTLLHAGALKCPPPSVCGFPDLGRGQLVFRTGTC